jgi:hypothetical protein
MKGIRKKRKKFFHNNSKNKQLADNKRKIPRLIIWQKLFGSIKVKIYIRNARPKQILENFSVTIL